MTAPHPEDRPASNLPTITEQQWYTLAIIAVIFTAVIAFFAGIWVFSATNISDQAARVAVIAPFGTIPIAIITFCTVAWRGMVTSRQADQQRRQNDAADDANYAKLLQEGAKLLADEKTTNQMAGVASLSILLNEPKARYRSEAIDVLAETIRAMFSHEMTASEVKKIATESLFGSINGQLRKQAQLGIFSNVDLALNVKKSDPVEFVFWPSFAGFKECEFNGGIISTHIESLITDNEAIYVRNTRVFACRIDMVDTRVYNSLVDSCDISCIDLHALSFSRNTFQDCNFSGCEMRQEITPVTIISTYCEGGWYDVFNPPMSDTPQDWSQAFNAKIYINGEWKPVYDFSGDEECFSEEEAEIIKSFNTHTVY